MVVDNFFVQCLKQVSLIQKEASNKMIARRLLTTIFLVSSLTFNEAAFSDLLSAFARLNRPKRPVFASSFEVTLACVTYRSLYLWSAIRWPSFTIFVLSELQLCRSPTTSHCHMRGNIYRTDSRMWPLSFTSHEMGYHAYHNRYLASLITGEVKMQARYYLDAYQIDSFASKQPMSMSIFYYEFCHLQISSQSLEGWARPEDQDGHLWRH